MGVHRERISCSRSDLFAPGLLGSVNSMRLGGPWLTLQISQATSVRSVETVKTSRKYNPGNTRHPSGLAVPRKLCKKNVHTSGPMRRDSRTASANCLRAGLQADDRKHIGDGLLQFRIFRPRFDLPSYPAGHESKSARELDHSTVLL